MAPWWWFLREPKHVGVTVGILIVLIFLWFYNCVHHCGGIKGAWILLLHGANMILLILLLHGTNMILLILLLHGTNMILLILLLHGTNMKIKVGEVWLFYCLNSTSSFLSTVFNYYRIFPSIVPVLFSSDHKPFAGNVDDVRFPSSVGGKQRCVPCCAVLCRAVPCCTVPCCAVLCRAVLCRAVLCRAVPCCAVPCRAVLCCAVPCRAVPCCAVPCRAVVTVRSQLQNSRWTSN
jgi:hypothetical protein